MSESFPRLQAKTRRFTLGAPRSVTVSPDGARVVFLRSQGGTDPVNCLWTLDVASGQERLVTDPRTLSSPEEDLPPEERVRRERSREQAGGVVSYSVDRAVSMSAFVLSGGLYVADLQDGSARRIDTAGPVLDPRIDPTGSRIAYVCGGALRVHDLTTGVDSALAQPEAATVTYGLAEFIAAEEMERHRGYWWSPDGAAILTARVDDAAVQRWHIADPANPDREPVAVAYPVAGTANVRVELLVLSLNGSRVPVSWGDEEYLSYAVWSEHGVLISVLPRDQRALRLLAVDPGTGITTRLHEAVDPAWVDIVPGVPAYLDDGALVWTRDIDGTNRLLVDDEPVTPPGLQVRGISGVDGGTVLFTASDEPTEIGLWSWRRETGPMLLTAEPGTHDGRCGGGTTVITSRTLDAADATVTVYRADGSSTPIRSLAQDPGLDVRVDLLSLRSHALRTAVVLPSWYQPGQRLPVLLDPYGGPHAQRVLAARGAYLTSQWFAEQGFAVVITDGRGTPGRGPEFERAVHGDLAAPVLDDQVDALHAVAAERPELDLSRVAIRGWSFGGYLAALAVLRRPDVFHAAVAGAPVTDWRLYDTCYTERYLGDPAAAPDAYERSSLIADAGALTRPLLLVHGLADDNVVAAHTLRLSSALLAAGRPHTVLPLSGVTHMTPQEVVAENLLLLQVDFLRSALGSASRALR